MKRIGIQPDRRLSFCQNWLELQSGYTNLLRQRTTKVKNQQTNMFTFYFCDPPFQWKGFAGKLCSRRTIFIVRNESRYPLSTQARQGRTRDAMKKKKRFACVSSADSSWWQNVVCTCNISWFHGLMDTLYHFMLWNIINFMIYRHLVVFTDPCPSLFCVTRFLSWQKNLQLLTEVIKRFDQFSFSHNPLHINGASPLYQAA